MNKNEKFKNLIQTDILTAFNKWKDITRKMNKKKNLMAIKSSIIIEVHDSDSELECEIAQEPEYDKRTLAVPFSDDDEDDQFSEAKLTRTKESEDEPHPSSTPRKVTRIKVNKPTLVKINPLACSTPLKPNYDLNVTHIGIEHISRISGRNNDTISECGSVISTSSESTIVYQREYSPNKSNNVCVKDQVIIPPGKNSIQTNSSANNTKLIYGEKNISNNVIRSPSKKRTAESERDTAKKKICVSGSQQRKSSTLPKSPNVHIENLKEKCSFNKNNELPSKGNEISSNAEKSSYTSNVTVCLNTAKEYIPQTQSNFAEALRNISDIQSKDIQGNKCNSISQIENGNSHNSSNEKESSCPGGDKSIVDREVTLKRKPTTAKKNGKSNDAVNHGNNVKKKPSSSTSMRTTQHNQNYSRRESTIVRERSCEHSPKKIKVNNSPSSSRSPQKLGLKSKIEGKQINHKPLMLLIDLFKTIYKSKYLKDLVPADKKQIIMFLKMDVEYQYVCLKLFMRQKKWYNIFKFCKLVGLSIEDSDVNELYNFFKENRIVDTDYIKDDIIDLLYLLDPTDLKCICNTFKSRPISVRKEDMINSLLKCCKTQSTLTNLKSTEDLIKERIKQKMGNCVKLNEEFYETFYRTYLLGTFTNPLFTDMADYFKNLSYLKVLFPDYSVQERIIFYTKEEFIRYARARRCQNEIEKFRGNHLETFKICNMAFKELKALQNIEGQNNEMYKNAPHLMRFTAGAVYVSVLSSAVKRLATQYSTGVKEWLEYMIKYETKFSHRIGDWYYHLIWIYMKYTNPLDYEHAAKLLIGVLRQHKEHLSEVQLHQLGKRGNLLKCTRKYKIEQLYHDTIACLVPRPICLEDLPQSKIDAKTVRENQCGRKRDYITYDKDGNKHYLQVEETALQHYLQHGFTGGKHCEGVLLKATFTLFFWDIIYMDLPDSFLSKIQSDPLDMYTKYFYLRRKDAIDKRLKEIESEWSHEELLKWVNNNYDQHSHELGFCEVGAYIEDRELLGTLVECVGRKVWAKIYERFVKNIRHYSSGMPDLLMWNINMKKSKFVEVKGENDKLSIGQTLWIKYLKENGADAEVCIVHSIGSKRKKVIKKVKGKIASETANSCNETTRLAGEVASSLDQATGSGGGVSGSVDEVASSSGETTNSPARVVRSLDEATGSAGREPVNGANTEVCIVHSIGSKRKNVIKKVEDKIASKTANSCKETTRLAGKVASSRSNHWFWC